MITTYNYPGSSSFKAVYHRDTKDDNRHVQEWWAKIHADHGPCAPGGGLRLTDKRL